MLSAGHEGDCKVDVAMEEEDYEVEAILEERVRSRKSQFLVKWLGWPEEDSTWGAAVTIGSSQVPCAPRAHERRGLGRPPAGLARISHSNPQ